ncbi:MAG: autotransporter outer membrane beta-barrel domain-containing protein [Sterolibacterium sp.]|nr:autotransporter outer membrane beta-barrel domain-containing protein [Sterolibacterium sp.]
MIKLSSSSILSVAGGLAAIILSSAASASPYGVPSTDPSSRPFEGGGSATGIPSPSTQPGPVVSPQAVQHALTETVSTQQISSTSLQQIVTISNAIGFRMSSLQPRPAHLTSNESLSGMAAGGQNAWNTWSNLTNNNNEYKSLSQNVVASTVGFDYALNPALVVGASVAVDRASGSLLNATTKGYSVAPYIGWQISKEFSLDASAGWGESKTQAGTVEFKPERFFYGANLNYTQWAGNLQFAGKASYLYGEEKYDATTLNTKNKIDQWRLGGQVSYWLSGGAMPFVGVSYSHDKTKTALITTNDLGKNAWLWSAGVNVFSLKDNLSGGIVFNRESGRSNSKRESVMLNLNYRF